MKFTVPSSLPELIFYIWKIIDLPTVNIDEFIHKTSFEYYLRPPKKTKVIVQNAIKQGLLIKDLNENLTLSQDLYDQFITWQETTKKEISEKMNIIKEFNESEKSKDKKVNFGILLKTLLDSGTMNRGISVPTDSIKITQQDIENGVIEAKISGTDEYKLIIDIKSKTLVHDCQDFISKRIKNKKLCKHVVKLFLMIKDENEPLSTKILKDIVENINNWDFSG